MYPLSYLFFFNRFKDGAWFEPSWDDRIKWMIQLLEIKSTDKIIDIGSGDGRVVEAIARAGAEAYGIEKDTKLVKKSRNRIEQAGLNQRAHIIEGDMWHYNYHLFNKATIYQLSTVMERMETKLQTELTPPSIVVSNYWRFPTWPCTKQIVDVYQYTNSGAENI